MWCCLYVVVCVVAVDVLVLRFVGCVYRCCVCVLCIVVACCWSVLFVLSVLSLLAWSLFVWLCVVVCVVVWFC